jgi:myo-inositol-1-phosphate synthase
VNILLHLPVGSEDAARFHAECCLEAGIAFINDSVDADSQYYEKSVLNPILGHL